MSLFNILNIAGSAMTAQSEKINIIATNLANAESIIYKNGKYYPYIAKKVIFQPSNSNQSGVGGVKVAAIINDKNPVQMIYDPNNPLSNTKGYVLKSNINPITETIDHISASRAYQANIEVLKTAKNIILKTLSIGE
ncbi:flagellar basal body rod protein FlgC [Buchnera aphidicola (Aphis craccivora)]|uniref:Flagellar basal-body rod protein FlgC n=2 Tax=cellular organisms TaxID=131567 RepID=A0A6G0XZ45_APHCR|nr:flagellar basal body rod protein FlgC [Buchnera aphidicola]KAF0745821.1 Flagellar basal-body rod protein FlgC [Aphis craccivora]QCI16580.1 flagellar basal body rod protein FlgC [Buchnera aphidicola (Aphis craccivora)]QLL40714.1 flagellar basal body rod protein FlgC [Buchnera aphidicola (Aphis craccivore)]WAI17553.1 MAG: flagellar basal body rod protein FlgC [Buchnera aphidicola (Aphis craccivora)]